MQCQLCASFGDARFKFDGFPVESLRKHSKIHQLQFGRISEGVRKTRSLEKKIFDRCFPGAISGAGTKSKNVETEIAVRRRRGRNDMVDGNNGGSTKKRRIRNNSASTKQETAIITSLLNLESPAAQKFGRISTQEKKKSDDCRSHGIAALRSHCRELERKFSQNGKLTCRQCSTTMAVATNVTNAVDHVTRCHFGQELYACRLCSKRCTAYFAIGHHINYGHHKSRDDACIDLSGEHENKIMELMTKCYGTAEKMDDGNCQIINASARKKSSTISTQATRKQVSVKSGRGGHGIMALRSKCHALQMKFSQNGKMTCRQCSTEVVAKNGRVTNAVDHVTRCHFGRDLYACRLCCKRSSCYTTLMQHGRDCHPHKSPMACFVDLSEQHEEEIMELMTQCYGAAAKEEDNTKNVAIANIPGRYVLTVAMRRCFHDLKRKFGKFTCRICAATHARADGLNAVSHIASIHFRKTLFTCRLCSKGFGSYLALKCHLRKMHGLGVVGNYNGHMEQYEKEIIEWMMTCFGEGEKTSQE